MLSKSELLEHVDDLFTHIDEQQAAIERLKIKSNQYAKRLVLDGYNDVSWEAGGMLFTPKEDSRER